MLDTLRLFHKSGFVMHDISMMIFNGNIMPFQKKTLLNSSTVLLILLLVEYLFLAATTVHNTLSIKMNDGQYSDFISSIHYIILLP